MIRAAVANSGHTRTDLTERDRAHLRENRCSICLMSFDEACRTDCMHYFCSECLMSYMATTLDAKCPLCRRALLRSTITYLGNPDEPREDVVAEQIIASEFSKVQKMLSDMRQILADDPTNKILLFTNFKTTMVKLSAVLSAAHIKFQKISGSMTRPQRTRRPTRFQYGCGL